MLPARPHRLGRFELLARLAKGGMAEIYLARPEGTSGLEHLVVVKRVLPHLAEEAEFVQMFLEEARLAARIDHPNVVRVLDVSSEGGEYFMAMEYLAGPGVAAINRRARLSETPVPWAVAAEIAAQACDGLHAAHELRDDAGRLLGLVHRDVSPHNLVLAEEGRVKLVDFGIAKAHDTAVRTHTGNIKGKFPYMSPEQCRGEPLDRRSDLFSLGIVLCELLVARRLFERSSDLLTLKAITEEPLPDPRSLEPGLPEVFERILLRALAREPEERYATAGELGIDLRAAMADLGRPSSPELLDQYVRDGCQDLVALHTSAVRRLGTRPPRASAEVPLLAGFETRATPDPADRPDADPAETRPGVRLGRRAPSPRPRRLFGGPLVWACLSIVLAGAAAGVAYRRWTRPAPLVGPPLRFGVVPSFSADVVRSEVAGLVGYLERKLGRPITVSVPRDYRTVTEQLLRGELDFGDLGPLQFVQAQRKAPGLTPVAAHSYEGAETYQGYLVVRDDSAASAPADLKGKRFCYVERGSASGYLLPRHFLRGQGLDPDKAFSAVRFSGTHSRVLEDVIAGHCDAGAVYSGALLSVTSLGIAGSRVRVLSVTGRLPYDVICASTRLSSDVTRALRAALLTLDPQRELGRKTLGHIYRVNRFVPVRPADYATVESAARADGLLD